MKRTKKVESIKSSILEKIHSEIDDLFKHKIRNQMLIAARIKDVMNEKNVTNAELARKLNKEPSVITRWLGGTHNFTLNTISEIEFSLQEDFIKKEEKTKTKFVSSVGATAIISGEMSGQWYFRFPSPSHFEPNLVIASAKYKPYEEQF